MAARIAAKTVGGLTAAAVGGGTYGFYTDEGTRRSILFWSVCAPIYAHYRLVQWRVSDLPDEEQGAAFEPLHERYAPTIEELTLSLKGMYLKQAQTVSTRDDIVPPAYMDFCKRCQDKVPTEFAPGQARKIVEEALGVPIEEVFSEWDDEPLGVASIGQAHKAVLKRDGRHVVVKVMMDGIEEKFRSDLSTIIRFCDLAQPQHSAPLREIEKQFLTEFDYRAEAQNMQDVHDNIMPVFGSEVVVPQPVKDLCTRNVLVMDYVPGVRLVDGVRAQYRRYAESQGRTLEDLEGEMKEKMRLGLIERKDVTEESQKWDMYRAIVAAKNGTMNAPRFLYNWTAGWVTKPVEYKWDEAPINLAKVIATINKVHAYEIFHDGVVNGDPHPGNILLCPDGRIGLIDYGQVKRLPLQTRGDYAKIIIALANDDEEAAVDAYIAAGVRTKYMKRDILFKLASFWNDRDDEPITGNMNIQEFMDWAQAEDPADELPPDLVMPARVNILLRGIANAFGMRLRTAPSWKPEAERFLQDHPEFGEPIVSRPPPASP